MLYAFVMFDKPDHADLRLRVRPDHLAYLGAVADRIAIAGPLTKDDGQETLGSLLVIEFPSRDAAHLWLANEPFNKAGLYASAAVQAFVNRWPQRAGFPETS